MTSVYFFSFMASLLISMALLPPLQATARRFQFMDLPNERKVHRMPIAKVGGLAFATAAIATLLLWAPKDELVVGTLIGGAAIVVFGAWDDRVNLNYRAKLAGQAVAAASAVGLGGIRLSAVPFLDDLPPAVLTVLTLLFIVGATNAINLADGLDGLAGGLSLLSFGAIGYLSYLSGDTTLTLLVLCLLGGLLGFMRFNTYPARIFMGDAGSQFLGFHLALFALLLTEGTRNPYSPALIGLLLGLPLLDTAGVFARRLLDGRSPFAADKNHVHHRLLLFGFSHREAVVVIYALQAGFVGLAVALRWHDDATLLATYTAAAVGVLSLFVIRDRLPWLPRLDRLRRQTEWPMQRLEQIPWLAAVPIRALAVVIPGFLILSVVFSGRVPQEIGALAVGAGGLVLLGIRLVPRYAGLFVRAGLYVTTLCLMFANEPPAGAPMATPANLFLLGVAILVLLTIRFGEGHRFQTTPLDYLMVFLALAVSALPGVEFGGINLGLFTAKIIVLLFSFELLLHAYARRLWQLALLSLAVAAGLMARALW